MNNENVTVPGDTLVCLLAVAEIFLEDYGDVECSGQTLSGNIEVVRKALNFDLIEELVEGRG